MSTWPKGSTHEVLADALGVKADEYERLRTRPVEYLDRLSQLESVDLPWLKDCDRLLFKLFPRHCRQFQNDVKAVLNSSSTYCIYNARNPFDIYLSNLKGGQLQREVHENVWRNYDTTGKRANIEVENLKHGLLQTCMDQEFLWQLLVKSGVRHGVVHYSEYQSLDFHHFASFLNQRLGPTGFDYDFRIEGYRHRRRLKTVCSKQDRSNAYGDKISNLDEVVAALGDIGISAEGLNWHL